jgi:autophagy-related protein 9
LFTVVLLQSDIQTIPWHAIVARLSDLRASHPSALSSRAARSSDPARQAERLDAHDVANRIMREENYLIALFNKSLLDISLPLLRPFAKIVGKERFGKSMLTQTLEWNLSFCLLGFLFGRDGQVRRAFLSERNKKELVEA